jgi:hypothetical protein
LNDRHLRSVINNVLGEIGRLSVPAVEDTLLRLASHPANWGAQSTAGRAIAQWHTLDNKSSPEFIALLERWQKGQYRSPANYSVNSKHYVQLTIVWTLYYSLLNHNDKSLPTAILNLVYHSLFNEHENVCNEVHRKLFPRLFPQYLDQIIQDWRSRPLPLSEKSPLSPWLVGLVKFAYRCKDLGQLDDVVAWFIDCINQISLQGGLHVFAQLDTIQKRWLIDEIFPRHFGQLSNLLLRFIQDREEGAELIHVFVVAHEKHPKVVDVTLAGWFKQWQKALGASAELQIESWLVALHHIGLVYQEIEKFDQFLPWLDAYLERDDQTQLYRIAEVLRDLHQIQAQLRTKIEQGEVDRAESIYVSTLVEGVVDGWLTDENANKTKHQTALLFWAEREQPNLTRQCNHTLLGHISWLTPYIVEPWSRKRRKIVRHLLPVILIIYETDAKIAEKILQEWMVRPQPAIQQLAYALQHALRKPILTWFLNLCRLLWILLRYSAQGLLWLCRILYKLIMGT